MGRQFDKFLVILGATVFSFPFFVSCSQSQPSKNHLGHGSPTQTEDETIGRDNTPSETPEDIDDYWTEERMRKAKPMPIPGAIIPDDDSGKVTDDNLPIAPLPKADPDSTLGTEPQLKTPQ